MSSRTLILSALLFVVGCSGSEGDASDAVQNEDAGQAERLEFTMPAKALLPNRELELSVVYTNALGDKQAGVQVEFSLVGAASGASLSPTKVLTGEGGVATTTLYAGSTASDLRVRARAGVNASEYLTVAVQPAVGTSLSVGVRYAGARTIASYTVTSLPNMTCAQALSSGVAGEFAYHFSAPDDLATFTIGYDLTTALVGWGKDDTGSKLVRACSEFKAPVTSNAAEAQMLVTLELRDIDLTLTAPLALEMEVNASAAVRQFGEASTRAVASVVSPNAAYSMFADADYLLDAVQNTLSTQGNLAGAASLATRRTAESLAATLQPALSSQQAGPTAYGEATGQELARRGASLILRWTLGASTLSALSALSADGSESLAFGELPPTSIITRFAPESAKLSVDQLRVNLGLGSYGKTLLASFKPEDRLARSGCGSVFTSWWTKSALTDLVSVADAQAACVASLAALDSAIDAELGLLDAKSAAMQLAGAVPVHDRSDDGAVDDLGPGEIAGSWGEDAIQAALQTPQRTAFQ